MSGIDSIMQDSNHDDATVHSRRPVHRLRRHGCSDWEESEDISDDDVGPGAQVESHAVTACGPASGEQCFVTETLVEDAGYAYEVCGCLLVGGRLQCARYRKLELTA